MLNFGRVSKTRQCSFPTQTLSHNSPAGAYLFNWRRSGVDISKFGRILHIVLVVDFEQAQAGWVKDHSQWVNACSKPTMKVRE